MKFDELPDIPKEWIDFAAGAFPVLPELSVPDRLQSLQARFDRFRQDTSGRERLLHLLHQGRVHSAWTSKNIQRLERPGSVVVVANIESDLFGGALSQFLKCLTAVKICLLLEAYEINAVPVCWICGPRTGSIHDGPVRILGGDSDLHRLYLQKKGSGATLPGAFEHSGHVSELIDKIAEIGRGVFDPEIIDSLVRAYAPPDTSLSSACARLLADLMDIWEMVVVDSRAEGLVSYANEEAMPLLHNTGDGESSKMLRGGLKQGEASSAESFRETSSAYWVQSRIFPVFACVVGPDDLGPFLNARTAWESCGMVPPVAWPASSATIIDAGSRRILNKYRLTLQDLFARETGVSDDLKKNVPWLSIAAQLDSLKTEVEQQMREFDDLAAEDKGFRKAKAGCREHILYQLDKMKRRVEGTAAQKEQVMLRQIHRVCSSLTPDGVRQEHGLAGIYFLLRYSRTMLSFLYESLDIMKFEHQLIHMD